MATPVLNIVEQGFKDKVSEWLSNWFTKSGEKYLRSVGQDYTADYLKKFEQFNAGNKSFIRESISKSFKSVPEQHHEELEKAILGYPNTLPQQYMPQAQGILHLKNVVESKAQQAGIKIVANGKRVPLMMHPDGPYAHNPAITEANSPIRKAAIQEVATKHNISANEAASYLDSVVRPQYGKNGVSHISWPQDFIEAGRLPVAQRWSKWGEEAASKISHNVFFGAQDQNLRAVVEAVYKTKGQVSADNVADFFDIYFKETNQGAWRKGTGVKAKSAFTETQEAEKLLHKTTGYIMTSRIALPHATQIVNTILNEGLLNTISGIRERITSWPQLRDLVVSSGAMEEELHRVAEQAIRGDKSLFERLFHQPGFNWIRARQVEITALAGRHQAIDAAQHFLQGDIRAANTLKRLGIDTSELQRTQILTSEMEKQAMYNAGNQAIFYRTPLNTPFQREGGPLGRIAFTYSHYHFNMFRTIKNAAINSYKEGGMKGVAAFTAKMGLLFPIAGALIQVAENGLYRRKLDEQDTQLTGGAVPALDIYFNALAHASAFGILYSINRANKQQMVTSMLTGPIVSLAINVGTDVTKAILGTSTRSGGTKHDWRPVERDLLNRIPVIGPTLGGTLVPHEEKPITVPRRPSRYKKYEEEGNIF